MLQFAFWKIETHWESCTSPIQYWMTSDTNIPLVLHCFLFTMALKGIQPAPNQQRRGGSKKLEGGSFKFVMPVTIHEVCAIWNIIYLLTYLLKPGAAVNHTSLMTHGRCDARPTVTFLASEHHRPFTGSKLYSWWQRHECMSGLPRNILGSAEDENRTRDPMISTPALSGCTLSWEFGNSSTKKSHHFFL